jgi:membrane fusion protein (multidrug efflux system)
MARTVEAEVVDIQESVTQVQEKSQKPESDKESPSKKLARWIFVLAAAIAATVVAQWWLHSQNYESTDDAQIEGHLDLVSAPSAERSSA